MNCLNVLGYYSPGSNLGLSSLLHLSLFLLHLPSSSGQSRNYHNGYLLSPPPSSNIYQAQAPYAYAGQGLNGQPVSQAYGHEGQLPFYSPLDYSGNDNNLAPIDTSQPLGEPSYGSNLSDENNVQSSLPVGPSKLLGLPSLPGTPPLPGDIYGPHYPERPLPMPGIQFPRGTGLEGGISFPADPSSDPSGVNYNTPSKPSEGRVLADSQNRLFRVRVTETPKSDQSRDPAVQRIIVNIRNRLGPERRLLFPPLNRIMLSLIAPRMLRFQFDMMLQAIVAEVVKKVVFPLIGVAAGGRGGAPAGGPATETGGGTRGTGGGASDSGGASGDGDTNEEENALPVKEVNQLLQQQLVAMGNSASKVAPTSFVVQAGPQGAPVMTAIQSPVTGMPGQMQFMVTGNQPGTGQQQQFIVQLQQPGGQIVGSGQAQQQVTATLVPMTINPMMGQASPMTGQNAGQPFMVMAQPGMGPLMTTQLTGQQVPLKPDQQIPQQIHIQFQMPSKGQHESLQVVSRDQAMAMSRPSDGQRDINNGDQSDHRDTDDQFELTNERLQFIDKELPNYGNSEHTKSPESNDNDKLDHKMVRSSSSGDQLDSSENANYEEATDRSERPVNDGGVNGRVPVSPEDEQDRAKRWNAVLTNYGKYLEQEPSTLGSELSTVARNVGPIPEGSAGSKKRRKKARKRKIKGD